MERATADRAADLSGNNAADSPHPAEASSDRPVAAPSASRQASAVTPSENLVFLLGFSSLMLLCSVMQLLLQSNSSELSLLLATGWIPIFAASVGKAIGCVSARTTGQTSAGSESRRSSQAFQFGLADLLCAVMVIAVLMGIPATFRETQEGACEALWNFLYGSILIVSIALLISSLRNRSIPGWMVGTPVFLGTLAHLICGPMADVYILLSWGLYGWCIGLALYTKFQNLQVDGVDNARS